MKKAVREILYYAIVIAMPSLVSLVTPPPAFKPNQNNISIPRSD